MKHERLRINFDHWTRTGKASRVIREFNIQRGDTVLLAIRKSGRERPSNVADQLANLRKVVKDAGGKVVGRIIYIGSGCNPSWVGAAALMAKRRRAKAILAETTDQFIRNDFYHSEDRPDVQATDHDLDQLMLVSKGVPLMTHLHPDADARECWSYRIKRGQAQKDQRGGRPRKRKPGDLKSRRWNKLVEVRRDRRAGLSVRQIATKYGIGKSTIADWLKR